MYNSRSSATDSRSTGGRYYGPVGEALVWTLKQGLGQVFEGTTREAWLEVYKSPHDEHSDREERGQRREG